MISLSRRAAKAEPSLPTSGSQADRQAAADTLVVVSEEMVKQEKRSQEQRKGRRKWKKVDGRDRRR